MREISDSCGRGNVIAIGILTEYEIRYTLQMILIMAIHWDEF